MKTLDLNMIGLPYFILSTLIMDIIRKIIYLYRDYINNSIIWYLVCGKQIAA